MSTTELATEEADTDERVRQWRAKRDREYADLQHAARASYHAMETWAKVGSVEEWRALLAKLADDCQLGAYLIERMGAERYLDPELLALLLVYRRRLAEESDGSAAALMAADMATIAYYHTLRINGWIGNFALLIEHEFFGQDGPAAKLKERYGYQVDGFKVRDYLERVGEQLLPLMERANRMMLRNLATLRTRPVVNVANAGQVNVAERQVNVTTVRPDGAI